MSSQEQKDGLYQERHGKKTDGSCIADMNFFLSNVVFPNVDGRFRFTSSVSSDGIYFILEKMSLSNRWSVHVKDLSKHGQAGIFIYYFPCKFSFIHSFILIVKVCQNKSSSLFSRCECFFQ